MRLNTFIYYFREAFHSILRNSWLSVASIGVVAVSLLILGSSLLLVLNANNIADNLESSVEISVFLKDETTPEEVEELEDTLGALPGVAELKFVSKQEALEEMQDNFGEQRDVLAGLEEKNPLPDTFRVKTQTVEQVVPLAREMAAYPQVDQVRYGQGVVENSGIKPVVRTGLVTMVLLAIAAIFLIATTIRLSVFARRKEIGIMKFLGATNWFVRFPFLLEGMFLGLAGALLAVGAVYYGYLSLIRSIQISLPFMQLVTDRSLLMPMLEGLLVLGLAFG